MNRDSHPGDRLDDLGALTAAEEALVEWAELIDADLRDRIDDSDRQRLHAAIQQNPAVAEAYDEARHARTIFAETSAAGCPPEVSTSILAAVDAESDLGSDAPNSRPTSFVRAQSPSPTPASRSSSHWLFRSAGIVAAALALFVILLPGRFDPFGTSGRTPTTVTADGETFSEAEIEAAVAEVRGAFAMLSQTVGQKTADVLRNEMNSEVGDRMQAPLRESLRRGVHSIPYMTPEAGNDQHSRNLSPPQARPEVLEMVTSLERTTT